MSRPLAQWHMTLLMKKVKKQIWALHSCGAVYVRWKFESTSPPHANSSPLKVNSKVEMAYFSELGGLGCDGDVEVEGVATPLDLD